MRLAVLFAFYATRFRDEPEKRRECLAWALINLRFAAFYIRHWRYRL